MKRLSIAAILLLACGINLPPEWTKPCGGHVTAALSSVTLADDCQPAQPGKPAESDRACEPGFAGCPSYCRQSSMQLQFGSTAIGDAKIEIRAVRLIDPATNKVIQTLSHREPKRWLTDHYAVWSEVLPANSTVKATYKLSGASQAIGNYSGRLSGGTQYRVEVDVAVDGEVRTLSISASREPEVVT